MIRRTTRNIFLVTLARMRNYVTTALVIGPPALVRNPAAYLLSVLLYIGSKQYVDQPHSAYCYASASPVVLTDT